MKKIKKNVMLVIFICSFFTNNSAMIQQDSDGDFYMAGCYDEYGCIVEQIKIFIKKVSREASKFFADLKNYFCFEEMAYMQSSEKIVCIQPTKIDYLLFLPNEILIEHIFPLGLQSCYNLKTYNGLQQGIFFLLKLREVNKRFLNLLTNDNIAHIIVSADANVNVEKQHWFWSFLSCVPDNLSDGKKSLLHWAVWQGCVDIIHILIKAGVYVPVGLFSKLQQLGIEKKKNK